jgi:hypothetical protein
MDKSPGSTGAGGKAGLPKSPDQGGTGGIDPSRNEAGLSGDREGVGVWSIAAGSIRGEEGSSGSGLYLDDDAWKSTRLQASLEECCDFALH